MRTPKIYPKIVRAMRQKTDLPERTVTINEKSSIQSDFIGPYARRENPVDFLTNLASDVADLVEKVIDKFSKQ